MHTSAEEELRTILSEPPTWLGFRALRAVLANWPEHAVEEALAAAEATLATWPDETRRAGHTWLDAVNTGYSEVTWRLIRHLDIGFWGLSGWDYPDGDPTHRPIAVKAVANAPHMALLSGMDFFAHGMRDEGIDRLIGSPHLKNLRHLGLAYNRITSSGVKALLSSRLGHGLRSLDLRGNSLTGQDIDAVLNSGSSRRRSALGLGGANGIEGLDQLEALAASPSLADLRELTISWPGAPDADKHVAKFLSSPNLGQLRTLAVGGGWERDLRVAVETIAAIARNRSLRRLKSLKVQSLHVDDAGIAGLRNAAFALEKLTVWGTGVGPAGIIALAGAPNCSRLSELMISGSVDDAAGVAVARSHHLRALKTLALYDDLLSRRHHDSTAFELIKNKPSLVSLDLRGLRIPETAIAYLVNSPLARSLRELTLLHVTHKVAESLARCNLTALQSLRVCRSAENFFPIVASAPAFVNLRDLQVEWYDGCCDEVARTLAESAYLNKLVALGYQGVKVQDETLIFLGPDGADALASAPFIGRLDEIYAGFLEPAVAKRLAASPKLRPECRRSIAGHINEAVGSV